MQGFSTFGWQHLLWLTVLAVSGAAVLYCGGPRKKDSTEASGGFHRGSSGGFLRGASAASAVLAMAGSAAAGIHETAEAGFGPASLPLHVCSMAGYGCFLHFLMTDNLRKKVRIEDFRKKMRTEDLRRKTGPVLRILSELLFFPGLPGAALALLFPGWTYMPAFSLYSSWEFLGHFGIVLYVLLSIRTGTIMPSDRRIPVLFCILYAAVMIPFDLRTGLNYGFLLLPSPDSPLSAIAGLTGGGIGYYAGYALFVLLVMAGCYYPFRRKNRRGSML